MTLTRPFALFVALLSLAAAGCEDCSSVNCYPCPPSVTFAVVEAGTNTPLTDVTITRESGERVSLDCQQAGAGLCAAVRNVDPGSYQYTVTAPGHGTVTVPFTIPTSEASGCCVCDFLSTPVAVTLPKL